MSATHRDTRDLKTEVDNTSPTPETHRGPDDTRCDPIHAHEPDPNDAPLGIAAALCRMALLRTRSLTVSGAYVHEPQGASCTLE